MSDSIPSSSQALLWLMKSGRSLRDPAVMAAMEHAAIIQRVTSGAATFAALKEAVDELASLAPKDHDVVIAAFNIRVVEVRFREPHTLLFRGFDQDGNHTWVVVHFSQMVARVVYLPKRGPERVITGFIVEETHEG